MEYNLKHIEKKKNNIIKVVFNGDSCQFLLGYVLYPQICEPWNAAAK